MRLRTSFILSLQNMITRNYGGRLGVNDVKRLREDRVSPLFEGNEEMALAATISKESIDFLTHRTHMIERAVEGKVQLEESDRDQLTLPGSAGSFTFSPRDLAVFPRFSRRLLGRLSRRP